MSHSLKIIVHPEPDFDLEAELPAELAAMAEQLTADADFLTGRYPSGAASKRETVQNGELAPVSNLQNSELTGSVEAPTLRRERGARWWLRAAAIVLMLSGLGTVLSGGDGQPASCPVSAEAIESASRSAMLVTKTVETKSVAEEPLLTRLATVDSPTVVVSQPVMPAVSVLPKATPVGVFHHLSGAEQEAFLDFNENASSLGASVSF